MALRATREEVENGHWWFVGRRAIIRTLAAELPPGPRLEIGCGYRGGIALALSEGMKIGLDRELEKLAWLSQEQSAHPVQANADQLPFDNGCFSSCLLLDVLEHVQDDWLVLAETHRILRAGGRAIVTVPAYPLLWSTHDQAEQHLRRYRRGQLLKLCKSLGLHPLRSGYFNTILFPVAAAWRLVSRRLFDGRRPHDDFHSLPTPVNQFLAAVFGAERYLAQHLPAPFGLSIFAVLEKQRNGPTES